MMQITINQQVLQMNDGATLLDAIAMLQFQPPFAAAVNQQFIPQTRYAQTQLQPNDNIDIIAPVTGG
jgi:sulfur carrier protein